MAENSKIEWTDHTFNPWIGCQRVAPGCANCYAEEMMDRRYGKAKWGPEGAGGTRVVAAESYWRQPLKWNREAEQSGVRRRVFCASLADVFEDWQGQMLMPDGSFANNAGTLATGMWTTDRFSGVSLRGGTSATTMNAVRSRLFRLIDETPWLDWLLVTKRPENIRKMWVHPSDTGRDYESLTRKRYNVWLLTSVSDQETADRNIPKLMECHDLAPVLGVSAEPLLGRINFGQSWEKHCGQHENGHSANWLGKLNECPHCDAGENASDDNYQCPMCHGTCRVRGLDWIIVGGESGAGARPCRVEDIRSIVGQCRDADVACFVKQLGAVPEIQGSYADWPDGVSVQRRGDRIRMILEDEKGGDSEEWPGGLRLRQFPEVQQ
jgi:protein gp37